MTVLGAELFFWGRFAYALIYLAGWPWLRTLAWFVSVVGMVLMAVQLNSSRMSLPPGQRQ